MDFEEWWQSELKINRWDQVIGNRALAKRAWSASRNGIIDPKQLAFVIEFAEHEHPLSHIHNEDGRFAWPNRWRVIKQFLEERKDAFR